MKRIKDYKKLFQVEGEIELKQIKSTYRNLVKEWHPDKFKPGEDQALVAEMKSREIIEAYHFLISIAPETHELNKAEYQETIDKGGITDIQHKGLVLKITFLDGTTFECFGVPKSVYIKLINSDKQIRFAKRKIFSSYLFRKSKKAIAA